MLDRVTITGPDDSIHVKDLVALSCEFPFVEWGILASVNRFGRPRFPSALWIMDVQAIKQDQLSSMQLSLHLCGRWVRQLLKGNNEVPAWLFNGFKRIQLNFHAEQNECQPVPFAHVLQGHYFDNRQVIFQFDGSGGNAHMLAAQENGVDNCVSLFDVSGGAGILPDHWPNPWQMSDPEHFAYHGYAGGLGPDNLEVQIPRIFEASKGARIWIDMETRVRSNGDQQFDLAKVRRCLEIAREYVAL